MCPPTPYLKRCFRKEVAFFVCAVLSREGHARKRWGGMQNLNNKKARWKPARFFESVMEAKIT
jgi:hypothetical protein